MIADNIQKYINYPKYSTHYNIIFNRRSNFSAQILYFNNLCKVNGLREYPQSNNNSIDMYILNNFMIEYAF